MEGADAQFELKTVLIFNPTLKPQSRKPLQDEIQQAKILFYYPLGSPVQQKRNHVGLAQGLYSFIDAMSSTPVQQPKQQVTYTNTDIFIIKQVQPDIWIFLGLTKMLSSSYCKDSAEYLTKQVHTYSHEPINEGVCFNFMDHFYLSLVTFQGPIGMQVALKERLPEFGKIMTEFIGRYVLLNQNQSTKKLDLNYYLFGGVRLTPLDPNYLLKFNYFQSILSTLDTCSKELIIFYGGYLVFNTLNPDLALFFYNYYYSLGEPFKFDDTKIKRKFTSLESHKQLTKMKYGYFINSMSYGGVDSKKELKKESKSNVIESRDSLSMVRQSDLLGLEDQTEINLVEVHIKVDGKLVPMGLNTFQSGKLLMISLSNTPLRQLERIQIQNRFFFDNVDRFNQKLSSILVPLANQQQFHRFIYINRINMGGKMTVPLSESQQINVTLRNIFKKLNDSIQDSILTTTSNYWVYGLRRLNRVLVVVMSNEIAIHKIEDYMERLGKDYFPAIYI